MPNNKIDIVYLWVDGADKKWHTEKEKWYKKITGKIMPDTQSAAESLYRDNGELLYSMRSVAECAPWVNHIYLITGFGQIPKWLNTKHPKITIIPHKQIMPKSAIPTFNSNSIEMCIPNIHGLQEQFIIMNDDTFFNKKLSPSFFFDKFGRARVNYTSYVKHTADINQWLAESDTYTTALINSAKILDETFGKKLYNYRPTHGIDPYIKSSWLECINNPKIKKQVQKQILNKFRTKDEIQRWTFNLYDFMRGRAIFKHTRAIKYGKKHWFSNWLYNILHYRQICKSNLVCTNAAVASRAILHAATFCINDAPENDINILRGNREFLQKRFPNKCEFEK